MSTVSAAEAEFGTDAYPIPNTNTERSIQKLSATSIFLALSAAFLVDIHLFAVAGAALWAFASWLNANALGLIILSVIIGTPTLWAATKAVILAFEAEREVEREAGPQNG